VVTADGTILNANSTSNSDLFWALKGGGNNFGIVTKLHLKTIPQGKMWGGLRVHGSYLTANLVNRIFKAVENFGKNQDPDAHLIVSSTYEGIIGLTAWTVSPFHAQPVKDPPVFKEFLDIRPAISTTRIDTVTSFAKELFVGTPGGKRYLFATATFKNDANAFAKLLDIHYNELSSVKAARGFQSSFILQPVLPLMTSKSAATGGNPMGISPESGPLVCK
jgi:FAD/FMN-containing dehydrogenase